LHNLTILDVGHGNCTILRDQQGVVIIDCGRGNTLVQYLHLKGISEIDTVLISHADADHIGGLYDLLGAKEISIKRIFLNGDIKKQTSTWETVRIALGERQATTRIDVQLTTHSTPDLKRLNIEIRVLYPTPSIALIGVGGKDSDGHILTSNDMSAVIKILTQNSDDVLLAADITRATLQKILADNADLQARVLVFPHHGGLPATDDPTQFAKELCSVVQPELVIFSHGRRLFRNPKAKVVAGVKQGAPNAHIACTQLSKNCATSIPAINFAPTSFGAGILENHCCAGTFVIELGNPTLQCLPLLARHNQFVTEHILSALCQKTPIELSTL